jgi:hypothetical protein
MVLETETWASWFDWMVSAACRAPAHVKAEALAQRPVLEYWERKGPLAPVAAVPAPVGQLGGDTS